MEKINIQSLDDLERAAREFVQITRGHRKFAFYGPMGSGKTTFIKAVCKAMGARDVVTSPSFALINEYRSACEDPFFHFDLYRINRIEEVYDLGYEEYFYSKAYCFIEWAEKAEMLLPVDSVRVHMEDGGSDSRIVRVDIQ